MRAVAMLLHAQLRQHWKSWLALAALTALVGGFVMAAATTGRRTAAAFPDFVARHGYDAVVYGGGPLSSLARIPQIALVTPAPGPINFAPRCASCRKPINSGSFGVFEVPPDGLPRMVKLLSSSWRCQPGRPCGTRGCCAAIRRGGRSRWRWSGPWLGSARRQAC